MAKQKAIIAETKTHTTAHKVAELTLPSLLKFIGSIDGGDLLSALWALSIIEKVIIHSATEDGMQVPSEVLTTVADKLAQGCYLQVYEKLNEVADGLPFIDYPDDLDVEINSPQEEMN